MEQLSVRDLMQATGGRLSDGTPRDQKVDRISIDSRTLSAGDVFWALAGERHDGHDFVPQAFQRGASLCVTSSFSPATIAGPHLQVEDTRAALMQLARWYRG